ncbi:FHA domain-containing protein [Nonomuraea sp. SYSU D8015]|uniref:FHA domain-containing protein n=1 Tax=Nonomuraea sp. SYSU D8015 TaxID=2593644 RepID=UPI001661271A|nr:FHA domain-containing protein [Nonomuraea sp. SYSU D8015]
MNVPDSLAYGVDPASPGDLHVRTLAGGLRVPPRPGRHVRFGRAGRPHVDLSVGADDQSVSRLHGEVTYRDNRWWLRNLGRQLVRLPRGQLMHSSTDPIPLAEGYTPLFIRGSGHRQHLVELYVAGHEDEVRAIRRQAVTIPPKVWHLDETELLLLVVLGERYLLYEESPRPLTYRQAEARLAYLRPEDRWRKNIIEDRIEAVRRRLHAAGFPYPLLHDDSDGRPYDNNLLHNLLRGLVESTTLVPPHLQLLETDLDLPPTRD